VPPNGLNTWWFFNWGGKGTHLFNSASKIAEFFFVYCICLVPFIKSGRKDNHAYLTIPSRILLFLFISEKQGKTGAKQVFLLITFK
jgi:hypothetical protein